MDNYELRHLVGNHSIMEINDDTFNSDMTNPSFFGTDLEQCEIWTFIVSFLETKSRYTLLLSKPSRLMNCQRDPRGGGGRIGGHGHRVFLLVES